MLPTTGMLREKEGGREGGREGGEEGERDRAQQVVKYHVTSGRVA